jgi:DNA polymerase-1
MQERNMKAMMTMQVHDELVFELPPEELDTLKTMVREIMPGAMKLAVPLKIDIKVGKNWGEMS